MSPWRRTSIMEMRLVYFRTLGAVEERPGDDLDTPAVEFAADDVAHTGEVANTAIADQDQECSWRLCFTTDVGRDFLAVRQRTRATLRRAEFGFFGVVVFTCKQTPRFKITSRAGLLDLVFALTVADQLINRWYREISEGAGRSLFPDGNRLPVFGMAANVERSTGHQMAQMTFSLRPRGCPRHPPGRHRLDLWVSWCAEMKLSDRGGPGDAHETRLNVDGACRRPTSCSPRG